MSAKHSSQKELWEQQLDRRCAQCKKTKPLSDFRKIKIGVRGGMDKRRAKRTSYCKECRAIRGKAAHKHYYAIPEYRARMKKAALEARWRKVLREMGVDEKTYLEMEEAQQRLCAICHKPETAKFKGTLRRLCIDHDHETGRIRELLCLDCNAGLGRFKDNIGLLSSAIDYLAKHARR